MAAADISDASAIVRCLGLENHAPLQNMTDPDVVLGNALVVETKYRTMCSLIKDSGCHVCVDLPCGYTPKALHLCTCPRQACVSSDLICPLSCRK